MNSQGEISAFDFETGKLHRYNPSGVSRGSTTPPLALTNDAIHLSAVQGDNFVISTGLYEQGRYRYYSLEDDSESYFIDYPVHPGYPDLSPYSTSVQSFASDRITRLSSARTSVAVKSTFVVSRAKRSRLPAVIAITIPTWMHAMKGLFE